MNWDEYLMALTVFVSTKSKDESTKVGCVIAGPDHGVRSTGFNGFPRGVNEDIVSRHERPTKYLYTEHAERNAIYNAAKNGTSLDGCTAYVTPLFCCADCARAIVQSGIKRLVCVAPQSSDERWAESFQVAEAILREGEVEVVYFFKG